MYRRELLAAGSMVLAAGCTTPLSESDTPEVSLGSIVYRNVTDTERTVHLRLRRADDDEDRGFDVVYDEEVAVPANSIDIVEGDWMSEPYEWTLLYATADELRMLRVPEEVHGAAEDDCNHVMASFAEPEGLTMWVRASLPIGEYRDELPSC